MNFLRITSVVATCALVFCTILLTGCQTEAQIAKDKKWVAERAAQLVGKKNPETGKPYTSEEATGAAQAENTFAYKTAAGIVYGPGMDAYTAAYNGDGTLTSAKMLNLPTPASMTAHPSPQVCPPTHMH